MEDEMLSIHGKGGEMRQSALPNPNAVVADSLGGLGAFKRSRFIRE